MTAPASPAPAHDAALVSELRRLAERVAAEAADLVRTTSPARVEVAATKSSPVDVVTAMDAASEVLIRRLILEARPDDAILGEEDGHVAGTSGLTWVVDPIDGTVNYLYGIPSYAVSIAVVAGTADPETWDALAGCVVRVPDGRSWSAGRGEGATADGEPIHVNEATDLSLSLVGTGFGYASERRAAQAQVLTHVLPRVRDIRRIGSAALDLAMVAEGQLDLVFERGLNPWDMAAGALLVTEAGGAVTGLRGRGASPDMTVAGPVRSAGELATLLAGLDADSGA
ncbi:inositol monophosphatase/fructose-1,6-bisphosphatase family protein [Sanguibacter keddieii DSM 10542]|uniref:Inositol-1-monophosphatase n=1 Tax=Sanguibacter keddieii (strain ATCC 51767 / DSM 10542 / NCFB 3025 / ST-74) TaxID=446469 RepID=D1BGG7_SANKS|nr:inositol monophosphatase family protein [Sanguibacter keddieii]ACZ21544.1 inositol monophosphatase/fructose-1,6-bisphosphatase family protein [Sanguibacter keddieii DSM 10542]